MVDQRIAREKIAQAVTVLNELDIDLWLTFCRESALVPDPAMDLIVGQGACWLSAYFIARNGETTVLVGEADAADFELSGLYQHVRTYATDVLSELREIIHRSNPHRIAINFSESNYAADGLSLGLYRQIEKALAGTPYQQRLVSAEEIIARVRGRKSPEEVRRLGRAAELAALCWDQAVDRIELGMSEIAIAGLLEEIIAGLGGTPSFKAIVNAGSKTKPGHSSPTRTVLEPGDLLHVDFGVRYQGYCSDIQRLLYFRRPLETSPPPQLEEAFATVRDIIALAVTLYRPGAVGHEIDALARQRLTAAGYPEFNHGLGHQIGQAVHDGGAIVGPLWPRYGNLGTIPLEENNAFTVEFGITLDGIGHVSLEEDVLVTAGGGVLLCRPQRELTVR